MAISYELVETVAAALDTSDTIVAVLNAESGAAGGLRMIDANDTFDRTIGRGLSDPMGLPLGEIAAPEAEADVSAIAAAVGSLNAWRGDLVCLDRAGSRVWIGCDLIPGRADGHASQHYVLVGHDITARRAEENAAKLLNNLLAKAFQVADVPLAIINADSRFVMTNQSMDTQLGFLPGQLAGKLAADSLTPSSRPRFLAARAQQHADGLSFQADTVLLLGNGQSMPVTMSSSVVDGLDRKRYSVMTTRKRDHATHVKARAAAAPRADAETSHQVAGRLRFIDLEAVREALKDRWDNIGPRVMDAAEHVIRKRLALADTMSRDGDRGFTICFSTATQEEASFRATAIAREVRQHLIGLGEDENAIAMQVVVAGIPVVPNKPAAEQIAHRLDAVAAQGLRAACTPIQQPRILTAYRTASGTPFALHVSPTPRPRTPGSVIIPGSTKGQDLAPIHWALGIDTTKQVHRLLVDINFELFQRRELAEAFLGACADLAIPVREQLHFILSPPPVGVTTSLVQDIIRRLKTYGLGVGCHLEEWGAPAFDLRACPLSWVVVDLSGWQGGSAGPPERLRRMTGLMGAHGVKTLARRVVSANALSALHDAGVYCATLRDGADAPVSRRAGRLDQQAYMQY